MRRTSARSVWRLLRNSKWKISQSLEWTRKWLATDCDDRWQIKLWRKLRRNANCEHFKEICKQKRNGKKEKRLNSVCECISTAIKRTHCSAHSQRFFRSSGSILIRAAHPIFNDKLSRSRKSTKLFEYFFFFKLKSLKCICGFERKCWQCKHSPLASLKCNYSFFFAFVVVASRCADAMCRLCQNHT